MKKVFALCALLCIIISNSCTKKSMDDFDIIKEKVADGITSGTSSAMLGIWERNDGQAQTYLKLEGSVATTCNSGTETVGTYDASVPSATFVVSGVTYVFPLYMQGSNLIVQVPSQSNNANHTDTEYIPATTWPCSNGGSGGGSGGTSGPNGVWQRYGSPGGYQTDLAIGGITGEPSNRVYMCEHPGSPSAGLYKGYINGNTITWDASYGLPNAEFNLLGSGPDRTLYFGVGALADAGKYALGTWTNTCGPIQYVTHKIAVGFNPNDPYLSDVSSISLSIDNIDCPFMLLNSVTTVPECSSNSFITVTEPQYQPIHSVLVTYTSGGTGHTESSGIYSSELTSQCNLYKFVRNGPTGNIYLVKIQ